MNEAVVGLDIGDVRIGVAVSDQLRLIANPVDVITRVGWGPDTKKILAVCERYHTSIVVSGLPLNMDGSEGPRAEKSRAFRVMLQERTSIPVVLWDERRSSVEAHQILHSNGKREKKHRESVDAVAASLILESYLGSLKK